MLRRSVRPYMALLMPCGSVRCYVYLLALQVIAAGCCQIQQQADLFSLLGLSFQIRALHFCLIRALQAAISVKLPF